MSCALCRGTGLVPFEKDGKIIPHVFKDCECIPPPDNIFYPIKPEDIDFPMSRDFYRQFANFYHWPDPGEMITEPPRQFSELKQFKTIINNYNTELNEQKIKKQEFKQEKPHGVEL